MDFRIKIKLKHFFLKQKKINQNQIKQKKEKKKQQKTNEKKKQKTKTMKQKPMYFFEKLEKLNVRNNFKKKKIISFKFILPRYSKVL